MKPDTVVSRPALLLGHLGGLVGTLAMVALVFVAPAFGLRLVDLPRLLGGVVSSSASAAFGVGLVAIFVVGTLAVPFALTSLWPLLPGGATGVVAAVTKGALTGAVLWIAWGLVLPLVARANALVGGPLATPGMFALGQGVGGGIWLLVTQLVYGLSVAAVADMGRGIEPLGTLGFGGYGMAAPPDPR